MRPRSLLATLLILAGLSLATWAQLNLRDRTGPQVLDQTFQHDAAGHTKAELVGVGAGVVLVLVGSLLVI